MYKEFTQSAELMRRERYRHPGTSLRRVRPSLRVVIGEALVDLGNRLADERIRSRRVEGLSV